MLDTFRFLQTGLGRGKQLGVFNRFGDLIGNQLQNRQVAFRKSGHFAALNGQGANGCGATCLFWVLPGLRRIRRGMIFLPSISEASLGAISSTEK